MRDSSAFRDNKMTKTTKDIFLVPFLLYFEPWHHFLIFSFYSQKFLFNLEQIFPIVPLAVSLMDELLKIFNIETKKIKKTLIWPFCYLDSTFSTISFLLPIISLRHWWKIDNEIHFKVTTCVVHIFEVYGIYLMKILWVLWHFWAEISRQSSINFVYTM